MRTGKFLVIGDEVRHMPTVTRDGVTIHYEVDGPAAGEPVVLVPGLGYGRWMWNWVRDALADEYRLLLPDNRGAGDSDAPEGPYAMADLVGDLEAVLADAGVDRAHVVGASMGGMIAQRYALEYDRAATLSLLCTTPGGPDAVPIPEETQARMFDVPPDADERELIEHRMAPALSGDFYETHPDLRDRIVDWRLESDAPDHAREAQAAAVAEFDASDELADLTLPTLILHGGADRVVPVENARLLADGIPDARLEILDGGPHLVFVEEADRVTDALREFLAANSLAAGGGSR
jgi:pimeloyl-ACP methyl ester carboxylesterase